MPEQKVFTDDTRVYREIALSTIPVNVNLISYGRRIAGDILEDYGIKEGDRIAMRRVNIQIFVSETNLVVGLSKI